MRKVFNVIILILIAILYQVIAYVIAKVAIYLTLTTPPYRLMGEGFNTIWTHVVLGLIALVLALYSYPADIQKEHKKLKQGEDNHG